MKSTDVRALTGLKPLPAMWTPPAVTGVPVKLIAVICGLGTIFYLYSLVRQTEFFRRKRSGETQRGPSLQDWVLFAMSLGFCLIAAFLWNSERNVAVVTLAFFGGCGLIFSAVILRKLRQRHFRPSVVRVRGGVNIYLARGRLLAMGGGCSAFGVVAFIAGGEYPLIFRALCAFVGLVGITVLAALCTPLYKRQFIRFEPEGLVIGQPAFSCRVPWDAIRLIAPFEYESTPMIGLLLTDPVHGDGIGCG